MGKINQGRRLGMWRRGLTILKSEVGEGITEGLTLKSQPRLQWGALWALEGRGKATSSLGMGSMGGSSATK